MFRSAAFLFIAFIPALAFSQTGMNTFFPGKMNDWEMSDSARHYRGEEIFDYIDGAGEIYRSFNFVSVAVQRYAAEKRPEILVEIFDMGSARNAFGLFTYMRGRGTRVSMGQDGEYRVGLLFFWKGQYFVCLQIENENGEASKAAFGLGKAVSAAITGEGTVPGIISLLPKNKVEENSVKFFYRYEILNIHHFVADKNILNLNDSVDAVLARLKGDKSSILIVRYAEENDAAAAFKNFLSENQAGQDSHAAFKSENGKWIAAVTDKKFLIINFDSPARDQSIIITNEFKRRLR